jgi:hypothetical protein
MTGLGSETAGVSHELKLRALLRFTGSTVVCNRLISWGLRWNSRRRQRKAAVVGG